MFKVIVGRYLPGFIAIAAIVAGLNTPVSAQSGNASIGGTIVDETKAAVPGVTVTLSSPALQVPQLIRVSEIEGDYLFPELPAGVYRVVYELPGFATLVREDIRLTTGFAARLDVTMTVATVAETVTVSGESPLVDVTNTRGGATVSSEILSTTPNSLTMQDVYLISGGVTANASPKNGEGGVRSQGPVSNPSTFGQSFSGLAGYQTLDGVLTFANQYPDFASVEEVDVRTFGNTADVGSPGLASVLIIKSGGNEFHGKLRAAIQNERWQGDNVDANLRAQGINRSRVLKYFYDYSGDLGGRLIRNKLWFYVAYHDLFAKAYVPGFSLDRGPDGIWSTTDDTPALSLTREPTPTAKLSLQASQNHRFIGFYSENILVEDSFGGTKFVPWEATFDYHQPFPTGKGEWQGTLSDRLFVSALWGYHFIGAYRTAQPCCAHMVSKFDMATQQQEGSAWVSLRGFRGATRHQFSGTMNYLPRGSFLGDHQLSAGWGLVPERFDSKFPVEPSGDYRLVYSNGVPVQFWTRSTPVLGTASQDKYFLHISDSWRPTRRLTMNLGLRWDRITAFIPEQEKLPGPWPFAKVGTFPSTNVGDWRELSPRVGGAFDLFGDGKTVIKGTYGLYKHEYPYGWVGQFSPNYVSETRYRWTDPDRNGDYTPGEVNLDPNGPDVLSVTGSTNTIVNPNLELTRTHEATGSIERELAGGVSLRALYVYKKQMGTQTTINTLRPFSAWNQQVTSRDPGPDGRAGTADDGALITFFDYDPAYRGSQFVAQTLVNSTDRSDTYKNMELSLRKRQTGKWFAYTTLLLTKNHRWLVPVVDNPNDAIVPLDETLNWSYRLTGGYEIPYGILVSTIYQADNGIRGARTVNFAAPSSGTLSIRSQAFGTNEAPGRHVVNLRTSKRFDVGGKRLSVNADVFNLLNTNAPWGQTFVSGPSYGFVTDFAQSRVLRFSAQVEF
jgi:hypothetical protein